VRHAEDLNPDLGARVAQVFEVHPDQQPDPRRGLGQRDETEAAGGAPDIECSSHGNSLP